ncbi:uncharacterized protein L203_101489 [Cryptococcus depauperatus CBS 7841]|uniref:Uncharacterized protein n=1 Tax=Cryptococcus depauperatus CBS 7841 TaxID=1295531 RepID=A0A1E3ITG1_9TREE|nr:hypothetical protein L203_01151 [Cryptococcus depauperatus CBS 7841]
MAAPAGVDHQEWLEFQKFQEFKRYQAAKATQKVQAAESSPARLVDISTDLAAVSIGDSIGSAPPVTRGLQDDEGWEGSSKSMSDSGPVPVQKTDNATNDKPKKAKPAGRDTPDTPLDDSVHGLNTSDKLLAQSEIQFRAESQLNTKPKEPSEPKKAAYIPWEGGVVYSSDAPTLDAKSYFQSLRTRGYGRKSGGRNNKPEAGKSKSGRHNQEGQDSLEHSTEFGAVPSPAAANVSGIAGWDEPTSPSGNKDTVGWSEPEFFNNNGGWEGSEPIPAFTLAASKSRIETDADGWGESQPADNAGGWGEMPSASHQPQQPQQPAAVHGISSNPLTPSIHPDRLRMLGNGSKGVFGITKSAPISAPSSSPLASGKNWTSVNMSSDSGWSSGRVKRSHRVADSSNAEPSAFPQLGSVAHAAPSSGPGTSRASKHRHQPNQTKALRGLQKPDTKPQDEVPHQQTTFNSNQFIDTKQRNKGWKSKVEKAPVTAEPSMVSAGSDNGWISTTDNGWGNSVNVGTSVDTGGW